MKFFAVIFQFIRLFIEGAYTWTGESESENGELLIMYSVRFKMIDKIKPISWFAENPSEVNKFTRDDRDNLMRKVILYQYDVGEDIRIKNTNFKNKNKYIIFPILIGLSICSYDFTMFASHRMAFFFGFLMPGGAVSFPIVYFVANIIQEVYGYKRIRQLLYIIIVAQLMILILSIITLLFSASSEIPIPILNLFHTFAPHLSNDDQLALFNGFYNYVLGQNVRNVIVNCFAISIGLFANAYIFAKMKNSTNGKMLWFRSIGATCVGEFIFTMIFVFGAFTEQITESSMWSMQFHLFSFKVIYEFISIPLTYILCSLIKKVEGIEVFDFTTSLNPFKFWDVEYDNNSQRRVEQ